MNMETQSVTDDELRSEYGPKDLGKGQRGRYAERVHADTVLVLLDPDVQDAFPTAEAVNAALRLILKAAQALKHPA